MGIIVRNRQSQTRRLAGEPLGMGEGALNGSEDPGVKGNALQGKRHELITSLWGGMNDREELDPEF